MIHRLTYREPAPLKVTHVPREPRIVDHLELRALCQCKHEPHARKMCLGMGCFCEYTERVTFEILVAL